MVDFALVPERTALINVDLQRCFVRESPVYAPGGAAVLERLNRLAAVCREAGVTVVHTRLVLRPDGSNLGMFGETSPPARAGILNEDAPSAQLDEELVVLPGDIVLDKPRFGAFFGTDLELILRSRGIDTLDHRGRRHQRLLRDDRARGHAAGVPCLLPERRHGDGGHGRVAGGRTAAGGVGDAAPPFCPGADRGGDDEREAAMEAATWT